jgi:succinyl-diaminopimelate desuccinylase
MPHFSNLPELQTPTAQLLLDLLKRRSITPEDHDCQSVMMSRLKTIGFECVEINSGEGAAYTKNFWALRKACNHHQSTPLLVFAGHTDVVPAGDMSQWQSDPFEPTVRDGALYARGAADMKASLAAFVVACEEFVAKHPNHQGHIGFLITSDEEGDAAHGTVKVCEYLTQQGIRPDYCVVGEPTSSQRLGDMIKNGRRGSLSAKLKIIGTQGHIAYPHLADNPIHRAAPVLAELVQTEWDKGNEFFPATTWQISNIHAGNGTTNIIPADVVIDFNFRYSTENTAEQLKARVEAVLQKHDVKYEIKWHLSGEPFLTKPAELSQAMLKAIADETGERAELSTTGGTSDGRFIAKICPQVIEFGPLNRSIHKVNEHIDLKHIEPLKNIYRRLLENTLI